jgi:hypothetical protein
MKGMVENLAEMGHHMFRLAFILECGWKRDDEEQKLIQLPLLGSCSRTAPEQEEASRFYGRTWENLEGYRCMPSSSCCTRPSQMGHG